MPVLLGVQACPLTLCRSSGQCVWGGGEGWQPAHFKPCIFPPSPSLSIPLWFQNSSTFFFEARTHSRLNFSDVACNSPRFRTLLTKDHARHLRCVFPMYFCVPIAGSLPPRMRKANRPSLLLCEFFFLWVNKGTGWRGSSGIPTCEKF